MTLAVHILKHGVTLCGIPWVSIGDPRARWVPFHSSTAHDDATCSLCRDRQEPAQRRPTP